MSELATDSGGRDPVMLVLFGIV